MSERYPRVRVRAQSGGLLIREGLSFSFYMRRSHKEVAHEVSRSLETYLRAVGPQALCWYYDDEGDPQPLDERRWELTRRELLESDLPMIQLADKSSENRYRFEYWGKNLESRHGWDKAHAVCAAMFWLPTEFLEEHGPGRVRELAMELAAPLPLCSGHGGLTFNAEYHLVG
ncbi:MAG: type VI immunity family protein, partial [Hyalangium sp.]|uniref:type VI immunity family protein n=1 Tax=Hyalangium sp. TaxID=2028555 RepID=UPI00389A9A62